MIPDYRYRHAAPRGCRGSFPRLQAVPTRTLVSWRPYKTGPWMHPTWVHRNYTEGNRGFPEAKGDPGCSPPCFASPRCKPWAQQAGRDLPPPPPPTPKAKTREDTTPPPPPPSQIRAPRKVNMAVTMTRSSLTRFWRTLYKSSSASTPTRGAIPRKAHKNQELQSGTSQARQLNLFPRHWSRPLPLQGGLPLHQHRLLPQQGEETWWKKLHQTG